MLDKPLTNEEKLLLYNRQSLPYMEAVEFYLWTRYTLTGRLFLFFRGACIEPPRQDVEIMTLERSRFCKELFEKDKEYRSKTEGNPVLFYTDGERNFVINDDAITLFRLDNTLRPFRVHPYGITEDRLACYLSRWDVEDLTKRLKNRGSDIRHIKVIRKKGGSGDIIIVEIKPKCIEKERGNVLNYK